MDRSILLAPLLALGILVVGLVSAFGAEAALPPDRSHEAPPPLRMDSIELLAREEALTLFRIGCLEVSVMVVPHRDGQIHLIASCIEWREVQPASQ